MEGSDEDPSNPPDGENMEEDMEGGNDADSGVDNQGQDEVMFDVEDFLEQIHEEYPTSPEEAARRFKRFLSWAVPYCYKMKKTTSPLSKHQPPDGITELAKTLLFAVLNGLLDKKNEFTEYKNNMAVAKPSLCGRVFKVGEPTYSCRDCGMDPTCVLCSTCFKQSGHKNHRYKISTSSGGGYCDCGDEEAWKSDKYCTEHQPVELGRDDRKLKPKELEERTIFLLKLLLDYAYKLLAFDITMNLPDDIVFKDEEMTGFPGVLRSAVEEELYCTVLYNDETHTFDTVISTLQRALDCSQREAMDYATMIDREGRCVVKIDIFQQCYHSKQIIERYTSRNGAKPLKVTVNQAHVVAHQTFCLRVLEWIEKFLEDSGAFRDIFADLVETMVDESGQRCMLEGIMLNDTKLWKSARSTWHHVLIAGLLKDYHLKKRFATLFARNYADMMKDFISDDHDHPFSITSLSVQIFTVPTIAHYLIEEHDVIFTIMRTLMSECEQKLNSGRSFQEKISESEWFKIALDYLTEDRKLEFDRGGNGTMLKRTNFVVIDLKYILTIPPTTWGDGLIKNFNRGMDYFLQLLCAMQEMDAVTRQTGNHMEYEPEWESAFNLQIKLQPVLTLSLEWLATNKSIFIRAFRFCLRELGKEYNRQTVRTTSKEFANHAVNCFVYDVATESVSVHLPLSRFFAGLFVYLEHYNMDYGATEFQVTDKPMPEILIEPSLRTQVLVAQVHAGLWKRNGYSLLNQLYFYQNVRCRTDMMDKDMISLQIGASLIEANEFLIHVINRFDLFQWADETFYDRYIANVEDDLYKHLATIVSEFLGLVINLFSARYVPGVGQVTKNDCIKKEIIQMLCIESMTHSTLTKSLVENVNGETGLEGVIEEVAVFRKSTSGQGHNYELKPEYYKEYDWHHYHYTREEMSRAEEKQRDRKKADKEPEIFPPPVLPPFTAQFTLVVNLLKSDVLLQMVSLTLQRCVKKSNKAVNDSHIRRALHLIGHGLNEEIARNEKEVEHFFQFCESCKRWNIFDILDGLLREPVLAQYHDMILWIKKQKSKIRPRSDTVTVEVEDEPMVQANEEEEKRKRARLAAETRAKILANMMAAQQKFMAVNADLFEDSYEAEMCEEVEMEPVATKTVCLGPNQTPIRVDDESYVCILCKEEHALSITSKRFVLAAFIQRSSVLCDTRDDLREKEMEKSTEFIEKPDIWMRRNLMLTPHVSSCGHIMHEVCWAAHIEGVVSKERRRPYRLRHPQSFDVDKSEWLCPMCDCICNAALPMALPLHKLYPVTDRVTEEYVIQVLEPIVNMWEDRRGIIKPPKKAEISPDITCPPPIPEPEKVGVQQARLIKRVMECFPPKEGFDGPKVMPEDKGERHALSFQVWLQGIEIMDHCTNKDLQTLEHEDAIEDGDAPEVEVKPRFGLPPSQSTIFTRRLLERLYRRGLPGDRLLEIFHGHLFLDNQDTTNWLHAKFYDKLLTFMERVYSVARDKAYDEPDISYHLHRSLWQSLAYTIIAAEAYHRDQKVSFFGENVPIRRSRGLKYLTRVCSVSVDSQFFSACWVNLQIDSKTVLRSEFMLLLLVIWHVDSNLPCIVELDAFGLLVFLTYLMPFAMCHTYDPSTFTNKPRWGGSSPKDDYPPSGGGGRMTIQPPTGSVLDHHNLRLAYTIQVYQIFLSMKRIEDWSIPCDPEKTPDCECSNVTDEETPPPVCSQNLTVENGHLTESSMKALMFHIWTLPRGSTETYSVLRLIQAHLNCDMLWEEISKQTIPFLRCCAKFYESMTGISAPPELEKVDSSFEDLVSYLDLPGTLYELFDCPEIVDLVVRWSSHPSMRVAVNPYEAKKSRDPNLRSLCKLSFPRNLQPLVDLPTDYTDLINSVSLFKCVKCDPHDSRMPTMCLICGEILCSQSYCCQQELKKESMGACTYHAYFCGGGIGVFLRIRECRLFLLSGRNKGCHMLPPYLDEYGETDQGLRRGNPMTLSREKYDYFRRLWIQHSIPEEIARITEHNNSLPTTEWVYL